MRYPLARAIGFALGILLVQLLGRVGDRIAAIERNQAEAVAA